MKSALVNTLAAIVCFAFTWAYIGSYDENTGRAAIFSACFALGVLAYGAYAWPYDARFLRTRLLLGYFVLVVALVLALLTIGALTEGKKLTSFEGFIRATSTRSGSWIVLSGHILFMVVLPFLVASLVRAGLIDLMVNAFGVRPFGSAQEGELEERAALEPKLWRVLGLGDSLVFVYIVLAWPGLWALNAIHDGRRSLGILFFLGWVICFGFLAIWLHRRKAVALWVSLLGLVSVVGAAIYGIWGL